MSNLIAEKCNHCGKVIVKEDTGDTSNRVTFVDCEYALLFCDYDGTKIHARPTLSLEGIILCLDCVVPFFQAWIDSVRKDKRYYLKEAKEKKDD